MAQRIAVVAYFDVDDQFQGKDSWKTVEQTGPTVSFAVAHHSALNLANTAAIKDQFRRCREDQQQEILGYVSTQLGKRPLDPATKSDGSPDLLTIYGQIKWWYDNFSGYVDGVFFDEGPSYPQDRFAADYKARQNFYLKLCDDFKNNEIPEVDVSGTKHIVGINAPLYPGHVDTDDPANYPQDWILRAADYIVVYENPVWKKAPPSQDLNLYEEFKAVKDSQGNLMDPPPWWTEPKNNHKIVHIIWDCQPNTNMTEIVRRSKAPDQNAGHIYVYDGNSGCAPPATCPDPQDPAGHPQGGYWRLPIYWDHLVQAVAGDTEAPATDCTLSPKPNAQGWNKAEVKVTLHATDRGLNPSGVDHITYSVNGAPEKTASGNQTEFDVPTEGETTITYAATDKAAPKPNTERPKKSCTVRIDVHDPTVEIVTPSDKKYFLLHQPVDAVYSCFDKGGSGLKSCILRLKGEDPQVVPNGSLLDTSALGTKELVLTAEDNAGRMTQKVIKYNVVQFKFTGFSPPVNAFPSLNTKEAGSIVPVEFSLGGNEGLDIFASDYPRSESIQCDKREREVEGKDPTSFPKGLFGMRESGLTYDSGSDQYRYDWQTDKAWRDGCRQLVVKLRDGSVYRANFKFE